MDRLKIGLAGTYFPNFDALKLGVYEEAKKGLRDLAHSLDFDLVAVEEGIKSREEAERAARQLEAAAVDFLLVQASSFSLGDVILPLVDVNARLGLWFLPEPSFEGEIPLNSFTGFNLFASIIRLHLRERNLPFKWLFGMTNTPRFRRRLEITIRALSALKHLSQTRIGLIGGAAPTFLNLDYDAPSIAQRLGVGIEVHPMHDVFRRVAGYSESQVREVVQAMVARAAEVRVTDGWLARTGQVYLALRDLASEGAYGALGVRCWPEFQSELGGIGPCAAISWLNETGLPVSCEGDVPGAISMLAAYHVSRAPVTMTDLVALAEEEGLVHMWHCGPSAPSWADEAGQALTYHPTLDRASPAGAPRSGVSSDLVFAPGPVTIARFSQSADKLLLMSAEVVEGPSRGYAGSRGWLANLRMNGEPMSIPDLIETVACYGLEHHYPLARGNWTDVFHELAAWAGIHVLERIPYQDYLIPVCPDPVRS
ncbi:MAG: L-fucose isomerase-like protein [Anaerolineae bacterium]